ncbi:MAG: hypothetical protein QXQ66_08055 [Candidatus Hadarchaeum sp.]|uniref:hypothetical protein n=1 Tax=Candidatus Hadarchaeum sp. TaxID=2883567 RepID=UPI003177A2CF
MGERDYLGQTVPGEVAVEGDAVVIGIKAKERAGRFPTYLVDGLPHRLLSMVRQETSSSHQRVSMSTAVRAWRYSPLALSLQWTTRSTSRKPVYSRSGPRRSAR